MSSPENQVSRIGFNGEKGVEQSYIQSSMDNFEMQSSQEEEELADTDNNRQFKVRDPEDLGTSLQQTNSGAQLAQSRS